MSSQENDKELHEEQQEFFPNPDAKAGQLHPSGSGGHQHSTSTGGDVSRSFAALTSENSEGARVGRLRRETAVPLEFVIKHIRLNVDSSELYGDLMVFIPFLIMFVFFFLYGRHVEQNFYILKGIRDRIMLTEYPAVDTQLNLFRQQVLQGQRLWIEKDKQYFDIGNFGDWSDWLQDAVVPSIWDCRRPNVSHELLAPLGQSYHLGAMRVRTIRMSPDSCGVDSSVYPDNTSAFPRTCYAIHDQDKEQKSLFCDTTNPLTGDQMFKYHECSDIPGGPISAVEGVYHCGGYFFEIPFNATCEQALQLVDMAQNCQFTDNWATRFAVVEYFVYTPQTDTFHGIKFYNEVLPAGWWYNQFMLRSFQVWTPVLTGQTVFDVVFLLFVLYYWVLFIYEFVQSIRKGPGGLAFFTEFWNILELVNLITFLAVFGLKFSWISTSRSADNIKFPFEGKYPPNLDRLMIVYNSQVYANSVNTILTFLKLLKYVRLNARLSVLTRTIAMCQQSIVGVLVLFVFVIIGYGITAWTLFGINIENFRNLGVAMSSLVRMLVGDIDYESMRRENRFLAGAFFWSFVILALFLLLNFLIAIISEAFAKISGKAYSQSFDEILLRWVQSLKAFWTPQNVKRMCKLFFSEKKESDLLRDTLSKLEDTKKAMEAEEKARREIERKARLDEGEEDEALEPLLNIEEEYTVMMRRADWKEWLDEELYEKLGDHFFDYTWDDIMNEYDDAKKSSEEVGKRHMQETVQTGVKKVLGDELDKVDQLDDMLTQLEVEVKKLVEALEKS